MNARHEVVMVFISHSEFACLGSKNRFCDVPKGLRDSFFIFIVGISEVSPFSLAGTISNSKEEPNAIV